MWIDLVVRQPLPFEAWRWCCPADAARAVARIVGETWHRVMCHLRPLVEPALEVTELSASTTSPKVEPYDTALDK